MKAENHIKKRKQIAAFLKNARENANITQQQLADRINMERATITKIENGVFNFGIDTLILLADALGVDDKLPMAQPPVERYTLQKGNDSNTWVATDTTNGIVCTFKHGKFNDTQAITFLEDITTNASKIASLMRELGDWLALKHRDKI